MNRFFKFRILPVAVIVLILLPACEKNKGKENDEDRGVVMQNVSLSGVVRDTEENPLAGVRVVTGTLSAVTGNDGTFTFEQAGTVNRRAVIRFEKSGYFSLTRSGAKENEMWIEATLQRKGNSDISLQTSFSASDGKTLSVGGMKVELPASAVVNVDGTAYSGVVNADMLYLDPNNSRFEAMMPGGDLVAIRDNNSEAQLISYGMTEVSLSDNAGNPLQLKEGERSELTFPIPEGMEDNPPSTIPLWYFDEERGIWVEEGTATLKGNVYVGEVSHFSWHNLDWPEDRVTVKGTVTDCENNPVSYVKVSVDQTSATTNSKGEYSVFVPANTSVTVTVKSKDYGGYAPEVSHNITGRTGNTIVTQNIELPCREQGTGDDAVFSVDKGSITYLMSGQTTIITFDNYGKRIRWDENYGTANHSVIIFDDLTQTYSIYYGLGMWSDMPYQGASAEALFSVFIYRGELYQMIPGFSTLANETIAGKSCSVITYSSNNTCGVKIAGWNGLIMLMEDCEGVTLAATDVSLNVPANAFTKTVDIF
jgi:hypothetical protein